MKLELFIGEQEMKFSAVANSPIVWKPWLEAVENEQMVGQELGQG